MWTRRQTLLGGLLLLLYGTGFKSTCIASPSRNRSTHGCMLSEAEVSQYIDEEADTRLFINGTEEMIPRSGNKDFDFALAHTLAKISTTLQVLPGFAYYDDYDGMNAYATSKVRLQKADGTVLFGQRMLKRLMTSPESPEVSVAAVCAHEFGHILQYKRGLHHEVGAAQKTVKRIELQADFFAGYFAGVRKLEKPNFPAAVFAMTQYNLGDNMINEPGHHGTSEERAGAITKGFEVAFHQKSSLAQAIQISTNYVKQL